MNIKASSLSNAIFFCLIISIFCSSLLLIFHFNSRVSNRLDTQNTLIRRNNSVINYLLNNTDELKYNTLEKVNLFDDELISFSIKKKWSFYDVLIIKSTNKKDTVSKTLLIGRKKEKNNLALYLTNLNIPLKITGNSKIIGDVKVPNKIIEKAYLLNLKNNKSTHKGNIFESDKELPKLKSFNFSDFYKEKKIPLKSLKSDSLYNSFEKETLIYSFDNYKIDNLTFKGNIILYSKNPIKISSSCSIEDILLVAPKVEIESNFSGNLHIISKNKVILNKGVKLLYPSSIYVKGNNIDSTKVHVKENSSIFGGIIIDSNKNTNYTINKLLIDKGANIIGNVYCSGDTQLKGKITGSIYTNRFVLKTDESNYSNIILNAEINKKKLPDYFVELPMFKESKSNIYKIVKKI